MTVVLCSRVKVLVYLLKSLLGLKERSSALARLERLRSEGFINQEGFMFHGSVTSND